MSHESVKPSFTLKQLRLSQRDAFFLSFGVVILAITSQLSIPLQPVPITLQSTTAILLGVFLGPRVAGYAVASYLALGFLGLPVFAAGPISLGPTVGYLLGFLPAAICAGYLANRQWCSHIWGSLALVAISTAIIYALGLTVLAAYLDFNWSQAITWGLLPFAITGLAKTVIAALLITQWRRRE